MSISLSYNRLWKLLIDRGMTKQDLRKATGLSSASIAKLGKGQNVTTDVLVRICNALNCNLHDIVETREE
nr:helix-turn-helix transcriptional regulator [Listeria monocytogenes]